MVAVVAQDIIEAVVVAGIRSLAALSHPERERLIDAVLLGGETVRVYKDAVPAVVRAVDDYLVALFYIPHLDGVGHAVFFEKENINTLDAKGEILLTIMASLAQQESQSLSQNVRMGIRYRYQQGKVSVGTTIRCASSRRISKKSSTPPAIAGVSVIRVQAVDSLRKDFRAAGLTGAPGAGKQVGVTHASADQLGLQGLGDGQLA